MNNGYLLLLQVVPVLFLLQAQVVQVLIVQAVAVLQVALVLLQVLQVQVKVQAVHQVL